MNDLCGQWVLIRVRQVLEAMARINKHPVVFALSTPEENAECAAIDAYLHTKGKALFCSGSQSTSVIEGNTLLKASQVCHLTQALTCTGT